MSFGDPFLLMLAAFLLLLVSVGLVTLFEHEDKE
jgi:hypothetical protein